MVATAYLPNTLVRDRSIESAHRLQCTFIQKIIGGGSSMSSFPVLGLDRKRFVFDELKIDGRRGAVI
jgi:hypothetical protein